MTEKIKTNPYAAPIVEHTDKSYLVLDVIAQKDRYIAALQKRIDDQADELDRLKRNEASLLLRLKGDTLRKECEALQAQYAEVLTELEELRPLVGVHTR